MKTISIQTSTPYDVVIGSGVLSSAGERIAAQKSVEKVMIVSDDVVYPLYGQMVRKSLESSGFQVFEFVFLHGEASKSLSVYASLLSALATARLTRSDLVVALGGGVVGDLAGFAAATYLRGIRYVQIPTTLLAAVDSSVGGKTAVDLPAGKNLVGAFHQPSLVLTDVDVFHTLPEEQYLSGAAETLKYGMISSKDRFDKWTDVPIRDCFEETVAAAVEMKRDLVQRDEFDNGCRMLLNFGHTFGHAAEAASNYSILHGFAVAMGMATITRAAAKLGYCSVETAEALDKTLKQYGLPTKLPFTADALLPEILMDKKARGNVQKLVVPESVGRCVIIETEQERLIDWLKAGGAR